METFRSFQWNAKNRMTTLSPFSCAENGIYPQGEIPLQNLKTCVSLNRSREEYLFTG